MKCRLIVLCLMLCCGVLIAKDALPKLIIGGDYNYPPYEFINEKGEPDGYNVELSRAICRELGYEPVFRLAKWSLVRGWLDSGSIDVVQGMAYSVARAQELRFSNAHTTTFRSIFVRRDSKIVDLKDEKDITVVVQKDDVAVDYLRQIGFQGRVSEVATQEEALKLLNDGIYEASVANFMMSMYIVRREKLDKIRALPLRIYQREYCYASKNPELINQINSALQTISYSGELMRIQDDWFSSLDDRLQGQRHLSNWGWRLSAILALALIMAIIFLCRYIRRLKQQRSALRHEIDRNLELELELDSNHASFVQGPVILFKLDYDAVRLLRVSENVNQWGYSAQELLEMSSSGISISYPEDKPRVQNSLQHMEEGVPMFLQYRVLTKSQEIRWVMDFSRLFIDERDSRKYVYGYVIDITDQKNLEVALLNAKQKAEAANIAKSHFLANMSHEIRNPLNGITGFLQVLMQMQAQPEQKEIYNLMYSSGKNLMKIINDVLDFSKIEAGKMELIISDFNPKLLISDLVKQYSYQNRKPELEIRSNISSSLPDVVRGDQLRLKQILINLVQNAIKFTDSGIIEVGAELYTISETDARVLLKVADTGIGIDPEKQKDIFDNFTQAESKIGLKYGGSGLGLAIVKKLVEMMQGFIWVESEPGKGSCFYFILPFALHKGSSTNMELETIPESIFVKMLDAHILLVEDDPINQMLIKRQLELWGLTVDIAQQGEEALRMHAEKKYQLILMDIHLPVMDGLTATGIIREREQGHQTPIIAVTAAALLGDRERILACGLDDYIAKPIDMNELYNILAKHLDSQE